MIRTLLLILPLVFFVTPASAQTNTQFLGSQPDITVSPEFPHPGETVSVELEVPGSELYNSDIVWRLNGQVIGDANNQRSTEFVAGEIGTVDTITASVLKPTGITNTYTANVQPTYIDIVLEPQTRVPDFYQGRALPSVGSQINATVLVNNGSLVTGDLLYTWRLNNRVLDGGPIRGTNQVSFDTPRGTRSTLTVTVSAAGGRVLGRKAMYFESVKPELYFYESNALYGQSHTAIDDSLILTGPAATIIAEPYNLDIRTYNNPDISEWEIDRTLQLNNNANPYLFTIQKIAEGGTSNVSFHVRSTTELLQGASNGIQIVY